MNTDTISILEDLIFNAILSNASDIHLEFILDKLKIRFRIDGELVKLDSIDKSLGILVISRLKVLSNMNVTQKRVPQDGKFTYDYQNRLIDIRVSSFPGVYGEKLVIRILDKFSHTLNVENLGFSEYIINYLRLLTNKTSGFFLVVGPTGSGKTTTLYSLLSLIDSNKKNIITLEDPVEYIIDGITQGQVNSEIDFTFAKGIRSILRQDPDIIMIGEIRDVETAKTALQASLTGHLVLSTLHTTDSVATVLRLLDMQIEPYLINSSLTGVLSQRLIKKLCNFCKTKVNLTDQEINFFEKYKINLASCYDSKGCSKCNNTGYSGRIVLSELLKFTNELRSLMTRNPIYSKIYDQACADGMISILDDMVKKVKNGYISYKELILFLN